MFVFLITFIHEETLDEKHVSCISSNETDAIEFASLAIVNSNEYFVNDVVVID